MQLPRVLSLALFTVLLAAGPLAAQTRFVKRAAAPRETVHVDLASGTITRGPRLLSRSTPTVSDFPNVDLGGFVGVDSGNSFCEWFNDGVKGVNGNASDLMDSFLFAYCSAKKDVSLGGPGGKVKLGFYEGYTRGGGPTGAPNGTAVAVFTLSGLPANSASSSFSGGFDCFFTEVKLDTPVSFADGPIGYSWLFSDVGNDGLAGTFPFLSCIGDTCGSGPFPDSLGQSPYGPCDVVPADRYVPPGSLFVPCPFAPTFLPWAVGIDIREVADTQATASAFTGDGVNRDVLSASPAIIGRPWSAQVTLGDFHGTSGVVTLFFHSRAVNGPSIPSPFGGRPLEVLVAGNRLGARTTTHNGLLSAPILASIPLETALVGRTWAAQAIVSGGGFADLTTCIVGVTGTQ